MTGGVVPHSEKRCFRGYHSRGPLVLLRSRLLRVRDIGGSASAPPVFATGGGSARGSRGSGSPPANVGRFFMLPSILFMLKPAISSNIRQLSVAGLFVRVAAVARKYRCSWTGAGKSAGEMLPSSKVCCFVSRGSQIADGPLVSGGIAVVVARRGHFCRVGNARQQGS